MKEYRLKNVEHNFHCDEMSIKQSLEVSKYKKKITIKLIQRFVLICLISFIFSRTTNFYYKKS